MSLACHWTHPPHPKNEKRSPFTSFAGFKIRSCPLWCHSSHWNLTDLSPSLVTTPSTGCSNAFILLLHLTSCSTRSALCWIVLPSGIRLLAKLGAVHICCRGLQICDWVETQCSRSCWKHTRWLLSKCIDSAAMPERTSVWWGLGVMSDHATLFCPPLLLFYSLIYSFFYTTFLELCGEESLVEVFYLFRKKIKGAARSSGKYIL